MNASRVCSYPVLCIKSKGAILMIWVSTAVYFYLSYDDSKYLKIIHALNNRNSLFFLYLTSILRIFFPLFGWIADTWIGRYRAILYGLYSLILGCVFLTGSVIAYCYEFNPLVSEIFFYMYSVFNSLGLAAIYANILPFITDQMIGASSDELSAAVHWWFWSFHFPSMVIMDFFCALRSTPPVTISLTSIVISFSGLTIAVSSMFLGHHWLNKTSQITNPIKHIAKILNYARKNKYPRYRSALTYWEQDIPSRLDLGKDKYGGPFSEEEVENVKTTLRLIPIIFICAMTGMAVDVSSKQQSHMTFNNDSILACFFNDQHRLFQQITTFGVPLYHFIIRPLLKKTTNYTPSMLTLIGAGLFIQVLETVGMVVIETIGHIQAPNATCMFNSIINEVMSLNYYWTITPLMLQAVGFFVCVIVLFEFIIAQSPHEMKGFLFGLWFAFDGIAKLIGYNLYRPFQFLPTSIPISCGFYYYLTQTLLLSLVFIIFLILSKHYKLRKRNNPVNIHMIAETHITAYIDQEEEYFREIDEENSINSLNYGSFGSTSN